MSEKVKFEKRESLKEKPDTANLGFGQYFTDYMLSVDYDADQGWHDMKIVPYAPFEISPAAQGLHYGQAVFEGLKAYKHNGEVVLFRPDQNFKRINNSLARLEMPEVDEEALLEGLKQLVDVERDWVPEGEGQSLYIRPFVFATEGILGVRSSHQYKLLIILSPSGAYYGGDTLKSTKIYVEVLWLDGVEQKYVEEVGSMNIFFVENGKVVTPALNGSILPGITRKSIIQLAEDLGYEVEERRVSIEELFNAYDKGELTEVFGSGTAAVISPVGTLRYEDREIVINNNEPGKITQKLYDTYTGIQSGKLEDKYGWRVEVPKY